MLFPTIQFLLFFLVVFAVAIFLKRSKFRKIYLAYLIIVSLIFYAFFDWKFSVLLLGAVFVNYFLNKKILKSNKKRLFFILAIVLNLVLLGFFKYFNFFVDSIFDLLFQLGIENSINVVQIIAPIGISFYVFRLISHNFDVFRGKIKSFDFLNFANYVVFFPQLTAGPIARAKEFYEDSKNLFDYNSNRVVILILSGLIKKLVISSYIFNLIQAQFAVPQGFSSVDLVLAALGYGAMIYTDFSGYSDLAEGISNLLGFRAPKNFDGPYAAFNIIDFWRRWHISLSTWLRDYLYIPLGGSRAGKLRKYINLIITMLLGGFWHGVGWNFILWGGMHGVMLSITHGIKDITSNFEFTNKKILKYFLNPISWLITFVFIHFTWIFFNVKNIEAGFDYIENIFNPETKTNTLLDIRFIFVIILVLLMNLFGQYLNKIMRIILKNLPKILKFIFVLILFYIVLQFAPEEVAPFIYFSF